VFCSVWFSLVLCVRSVLWHCWLGHLTRKKPAPDMTYNVFGGTLNLTQSINQSLQFQSTTCHSSPLPMTPLYYLWFQPITCNSSPLPMTPLYYLQFQPINCNSNLSPAIPVHYPCLHCITCDSFSYFICLSWVSSIQCSRSCSRRLTCCCRLRICRRTIQSITSSLDNDWCTAVLIHGEIQSAFNSKL